MYKNWAFTSTHPQRVFNINECNSTASVGFPIRETRVSLNYLNSALETTGIDWDKSNQISEAIEPILRFND